MTAQVCVVGSVNMDHVFTVASLPHPGETVMASTVRLVPGGKGGNQAIAAARAGADVQLVAALGDDPTGDQLRAHLQANGVGLDGLAAVTGPSGSAVIAVDAAGENTIVVAPGANTQLTVESSQARAAISASEVLLLQLEIPVTTAVDAARVARDNGTVVIVNASPSGAPPHDLLSLARLADVVVVNEAEAREWHWPVTHLVITRGSRGASYLGDEERFDVPAPAVRAVDTTGAGDVFAGVLAAEWPTGHEQALRRACAAGALATTVWGAGDCAPFAEAIDGAAATR
jgi:ribokinase